MDENPDQLSFFPGSDDESKKRKDNNKKRKVNNNKKIKQNENKTNKLEQTNEINHSIIMINNNSQIKIVSHDAPGEIMAGEKKILVVIKGSPFTFRITRNNDPNLDFRYMALSSILIYDQMNERQVGYLKKMPLETKTSLSEDGSFIDLESRISVLSSQHEDMAFRIKIVALNPDNGLPFDQNILLYTDPIRVVSKPEQVRKKESKSSTNDQKSKAVSKNDQSINVAIEIKNKQDSHLEFVSQLLTHTGNNNNQNYGMPNNNFNNNYNNNNNFNMNNNMNNMNNNNFNNNFNNNNNNFNMNNNNSTLMNSFFNNQNNNGNNNSLNNNLFNDPFSNTFNNNNIFTNQLNQYANNNNAQKEDTFESVFLDFVNCYASLDHQDKSNNIRRIIKTSSQKELETLSELSDLIASECNFTITEKKDKLYICNCKDCIYKKELSQVDSFYRDWDVN